MVICRICNTEFRNEKQLSIHIRHKHGMNSKDYYDSFFKTNKDGICKNCKKKTKFNNRIRGYYDYCSPECATNSKLVKEKRKETSLIKYSKEHYTNRDKANNTVKEKYGVDNVFTLSDIKDKIKQIKIDRYGDTKYVNVEKRIQTLKKNPNIIINRAKKVKQKAHSRIVKKIENTIDKHKLNIKLFQYNHFSEIIFTCLECNNNFEIQSQMFLYRLRNKEQICNICNPYHPNTSKSHTEIFEFIKELIPNEEIIMNSKAIIPPLELGIYIPSYNMAIEFNGLYWHSDLHINKYYHQNKTNICENKGIHLIHIYSDDWEYHKEIVKSRLRKIFNVNCDIIDSELCEIREIDVNISKSFITENDIVCNDSVEINIGLFYNNELISLLSCNHTTVNFYDRINTTINVSFHKLFNYFIVKYKPNNVVAYLDRSWFTQDNFYKEFGFTFESHTEPNCYYVHRNDNIRKSNSIGDGEFKIYDSGSLKYQWRIK